MPIAVADAVLGFLLSIHMHRESAVSLLIFVSFLLSSLNGVQHVVRDVASVLFLRKEFFSLIFGVFCTFSANCWAMVYGDACCSAQARVVCERNVGSHCCLIGCWLAVFKIMVVRMQEH